ncbi:hypothetical protein [uncultured Desulfobacter sp.]|nr:hypothetical protein [uncultured Desulfobacter sp.]
MQKKKGNRRSGHGQNPGICLETPPADESATGGDANIKEGQRKVTGADS